MYSLNKDRKVIQSVSQLVEVDPQDLINQITSIDMQIVPFLDRKQKLVDQLIAIGVAIPEMAETVSVVPEVATGLNVAVAPVSVDPKPTPLI